MTTHAAPSGAFDVKEKTIAELQSAMLSGKTTSQQLVQLYLARIASIDKSGPRLNAVIELTPMPWPSRLRWMLSERPPDHAAPCTAYRFCSRTT